MHTKIINKKNYSQNISLAEKCYCELLKEERFVIQSIHSVQEYDLERHYLSCHATVVLSVIQLAKTQPGFSADFVYDLFYALLI